APRGSRRARAHGPARPRDRRRAVPHLSRAPRHPGDACRHRLSAPSVAAPARVRYRRAASWGAARATPHPLRPLTITTRTRPLPRRRIGVGRAVGPAHRIRTALAAMLVLIAGLAVAGALALPRTPPPELVPALIYLVVVGLVTNVGGRRAGFVGVVACSLAFD